MDLSGPVVVLSSPATEDLCEVCGLADELHTQLGRSVRLPNRFPYKRRVARALSPLVTSVTKVPHSISAGVVQLLHPVILGGIT